MQELTEQLEQCNVKIASLEKAKHRLAGEVEDAHVDVERVSFIYNFNKDVAVQLYDCTTVMIFRPNHM